MLNIWTIQYYCGMIFVQMVIIKIGQTQSVQMQQKPVQILRMQQNSLLQLPSDEFNRMIIEVEQSPLFVRLSQKEKLIQYQRFPKTDISSNFYKLNEDLVAGTDEPDIQSLLLNKEKIVRHIQKIGLDNFKYYFLYPKLGMSNEEVASGCDLDVSEVKEINRLINELSVISEFYYPSKFKSYELHYCKVASIERDENGFVINYFSPTFSRGRYSINYERFEKLIKHGVFNKSEVKEARKLLKKLELINSCKCTLDLTIQNIVKKQALYLETGDSRSLLPFSQRELAKKIGLAPSSVNQTIRGRSIDTPWGEEIIIKEFFPKPKKFRKELLEQLLKTENELSSDMMIRDKLWEKFGVSISRRSVANLRNELKFPAPGIKKHSNQKQKPL
jgi:transposase